MPEFAYRAMDQRQRWLRGRLRAVSELELDQRLRDRGVDLIDCKEIKVTRGLNLFGSKISSRDLTQFCIHLEQMDAAGVPLIESLSEARDSVVSQQLQDVITEIERDVNEGAPLSTAFGAHPEVFGEVFSSLIAAGETTGNLTDSFNQLVRHLKWTEALNAKIKKATRYPIILGIAVFGAGMFMMMFVVPQVVEMLKMIGQELPFATLALIATSNVIQDYWYLILSLPVAVFVLFKLARGTSEDFAFKTDVVALRLPVAGDVIRKMALSRFAHIFAVTFQSGIEILDCLESAKRMIGNRCLRQAVDVVKDQVQGGDSLSVAMRTSGEFPPMVVHMVKVGEDSGNLEATLWNVAEFYDRDVNEAVDAMISMIEPALIVVMGGMMAWIAVGVFGPLYSNLGSLGM
ncbi:MAG: type II secretion system F family protein [Proteobacteria bacterium]|nr:type II secretion system F family protein [Pseudomonadota bacterium]